MEYDRMVAVFFSMLNLIEFHFVQKLYQFPSNLKRNRNLFSKEKKIYPVKKSAFLAYYVF